MFAVPGQDGFERRVKTVESLLRVLDSLPLEEPPADLIHRTLRRIDQRGGYGKGVHQDSQTQQPGQRHSA
jgi:hypothetical protein